ncbi:MAG: dihydropteroate synthase [Thermodesulfobacteriota bacterium]
MTSLKGLTHGMDGVMPSGRSTVIMGILNITPDSFSDGGDYVEPSKAVTRAVQMLSEGADWIDVGGESSRPGASPVTASEEAGRIMPVIKTLIKEGVTISVDTTKSYVAGLALEEGASIINDISAFSMDPEMAALCARFKAFCVLMHKRGTPATMQSDTEYANLSDEVYSYLESRIKYAVERGVERERIMIDPGIGFGKSARGNLELIRSIPYFKKLGCPLLLGVSRKSFIGAVTGEADGERLSGSLAAATAAVLKGADVLRVHDVRETKKAVLMAEAISGGASPLPLYPS